MFSLSDEAVAENLKLCECDCHFYVAVCGSAVIFMVSCSYPHIIDCPDGILVSFSVCPWTMITENMFVILQWRNNG